MKKEYTSICLMKVPHCSYDTHGETESNFRTKSTFRPVPSLALASLAGFIEKYKALDYRIQAVDVNIEAYESPETPIVLSRYGQLLEQSIRDREYDVLCLSVMFVFNFEWAMDAVRYSRKYHPEAKIIVGGGYPTLFPDHCRTHLDVDDIMVGEGEVALLSLLNRYNGYTDEDFENRFSGQGFELGCQGDAVTLRESDFVSLDALPAPAWHYLDVEKYFRRSGDSILPIEGSRGCPYTCTYCCTYLSWGRRVRTKTVGNLIGEIREISRKYGVKQLHFVDDNLSFYRKWFTSFLTALIQDPVDVKLSASNFSIKHLDEEIIDLLIQAKMDNFGIAVESGSHEIQRKINKRLDFDKARLVVRLMKERDIKVHICWMVGFPHETMAQINKTFDLARELRADSNQFLTVLPYPGTQLFQEAKADGLLVFDDGDLSKYDNRKCDYLKSDEWDYELLQTLIYDINIEINFLNSPLLEQGVPLADQLRFFQGVVKKLPEHIMAHIILGYVFGLHGRGDEWNRHYEKAVHYLEDGQLGAVFKPYLLWDHPIIKAFKAYIASEKAASKK